MKSKDLGLYRSYQGQNGEVRTLTKLGNRLVSFRRLGYSARFHFICPRNAFARWAKKEAQ